MKRGCMRVSRELGEAVFNAFPAQSCVLFKLKPTFLLPNIFMAHSRGYCFLPPPPPPHAQSISTTTFQIFGGPPLLVTNFLPATMPHKPKKFHCPLTSNIFHHTPVAKWVATISTSFSQICLFIIVNNKNNKSGSSNPKAGSIPPEERY